MRTLLMGIATALCLTGCGSSNNNEVPPTPTPPPPPPEPDAFVEVIHASPDAPNVNIRIDGEEAFSDVPYKAVGGALLVEETVSVEVEGIIPGGNAVVIGPADIDPVTGDRTTVVAVNAVADIEPLVLSASIEGLSGTDAQVRIVHAAPAAPMVDVYVTAPDDDLSSASPTGTMEFKGVLGPVSVAEGSYRVRVTAAGDPAALVFDADAELTGGTDVIVLAVQNVGTGAAPVSLLASIYDPQDAAAVASAEILDRGTPAAVRLIHASPDAPAVDVVAGDNFDAPVVAEFAFPETTPYLDIPAGELNVKVVPIRSTAPSDAVIDATLDYEAGTAYSVYATGFVAEIAPLRLEDDLRRVATEARVRLVHASPSAGEVDIYVVEPGASIDGAQPAFTAVAFGAETGFVPLAPGSYDVTITPTGTTDAAIGPVALSVEAGGIYTAAARDAAGGGTPLGLILLDDLAP